MDLKTEERRQRELKGIVMKDRRQHFKFKDCVGYRKVRESNNCILSGKCNVCLRKETGPK